MSTYSNYSTRQADSYLRLTVITLLFVIPFPVVESFLRQSVSVAALNILRSGLICAQGVSALRVMWQLEKSTGLRALPLASFFFAVQHVAFGFGGLLISVSDAGYLYANEHGTFSFGEALLPLLLVHFVSMNAGLVGVWSVSATRRRSRLLGVLRESPLGSSWTWNELGPYCLFTTALFGLVIAIDLFPQARVPAFLKYSSDAFSAAASSTIILWGLSWPTCRKRAVLFAFLGSYFVMEVIRGQRGNFLMVTALFAFGLICGQGWRLVSRRALIWTPLIALILWGFVKSEDVRGTFSRGVPQDTAEAVQRLESLAGTAASTSGGSYYDAVGNPLGAIFRVGSRLCETSAMDVVSRTPDAVPFWGWTGQDWSAMLDGLLPAKFRPGAAEIFDDYSGPLWLRQYGWTNVDPANGNAMPATMIADVWRRFGWPGTFLAFFSWGWLLANGTAMLAAFSRPVVLLISAAVAANIAGLYSADWVGLMSSLPRRLLLPVIFAVVTRVLVAVLRLPAREPKRQQSALPPELIAIRTGVVSVGGSSTVDHIESKGIL